MTSSHETDRAYSNKKPQLPEPARGQRAVKAVAGKVTGKN